jgi:hypothetical protein
MSEEASDEAMPISERLAKANGGTNETRPTKWGGGKSVNLSKGGTLGGKRPIRAGSKREPQPERVGPDPLPDQAEGESEGSNPPE